MKRIVMRDLHIRRNIPEFPNSYVLLSTTENVDKAIFFVHGFMGSSEDTFWAFQYFCDADLMPDWWASADLYFFAYRSFRDLLSTSAQKWSAFLNRHFPHPPAGLFEISAAERPFRTYEQSIRIRSSPVNYTNITLVGHSEGAVLIRSELINRSKNAYAWKPEKDLNNDPVLHGLVRLFAPAHLGACPTGIFALIFNTPILKTAANVFLDWSKAATELRKSEMIGQLREDTEYIARRTKLPAYHADVVFGDNECVVSVGKFGCDNQHDNLVGHSHTSVCKPKVTFVFPLTYVSEERKSGYGA
jgi:hypothetical protein